MDPKDITISYSFSSNHRLVAVSDKNTTVFGGVAKNELVFNPQKSKVLDLVLRAFNNRTREKNYLSKCCELLDGFITEEEFEKEITENEYKYVIPEGKPASIDDIQEALTISKDMMGIDTVDEFAELFSIDQESITKSLAFSHGE